MTRSHSRRSSCATVIKSAPLVTSRLDKQCLLFDHKAQIGAPVRGFFAQSSALGAAIH